jgi:hypothetical protein
MLKKKSAGNRPGNCIAEICPGWEIGIENQGGVKECCEDGNVEKAKKQIALPHITASIRKALTMKSQAFDPPSLVGSEGCSGSFIETRVVVVAEKSEASRMCPSLRPTTSCSSNKASESFVVLALWRKVFSTIRSISTGRFV